MKKYYSVKLNKSYDDNSTVFAEIKTKDEDHQKRIEEYFKKYEVLKIQEIEKSEFDSIPDKRTFELSRINTHFNEPAHTLDQINEQVEKFKKKYQMDSKPSELPTNILLNSFADKSQNNFLPSSYNVGGAAAADAAAEELNNDRSSFDTIGENLKQLKNNVQAQKPGNIDELIREIEKLEVDIAALRERNLELKKELDLLILHQKKENEHKSVKSENEQLQDKIKKVRDGAMNVKGDINQSLEGLEDDKKKRANRFFFFTNTSST
ncbi:MAG: hypothetical protein RQ763_08055, partial [Sulfurimonas sp.]|uniref:hypothetical protein n=1 Tax=Sulfurimonas sp. TaxID=2022749 RepID=UPI0028CF771E